LLPDEWSETLIKLVIIHCLWRIGLTQDIPTYLDDDTMMFIDSLAWDQNLQKFCREAYNAKDTTEAG